MKSQRLFFQSFHKDQTLLSALNVLSIHTKLLLAGKADAKRKEDADRAGATLREFLEELDSIASTLSQDVPQAVLGTDLRSRQLAQSYARARQDRRTFRSPLFRGAVRDAFPFLAASNREERVKLLECLADLRKLLESHLHANAARILGKI